MKTCLLYFSLTGNTKRFAEAISNSLGIPALDLSKSNPDLVKDFDLVIIGTPIHGFSPARPVSSFIEKLPETNDKKVIIFSTYAIRQGKANMKLEKELAEKGYQTILSL